MRRLSKRKKQQQERDLSSQIKVLNQKLTFHGLTPITKRQSDLFSSYNSGKHIAAIGSAGTGKTLCGLYLGLKDVLVDNLADSVTIIRSAVQTRNVGFMPGDKEQKEANYEAGYTDLVNDLFQDSNAYNLLKKAKRIHFDSTSFIRSRTISNSIIIVDECQNMRYDELRTVITRVGENSRILFCGDTKQNDLIGSSNRSDVSGLIMFLNVLKTMPSFDLITFTVDDVVRSGIVKEYILAEENLEAA